ncbi:MAG: Small subunit (SSU) processome component [Caeruleum heppii]|nr:MAG: Small subunit (SSU) processome component [Caeruleum heppii]
MVRKLAHHERKLLRKVDFTTYPSDPTHRSATVCRRYAIQKPSDYTAYDRLCGQLRKLAHRLSLLDAEDPLRRKMEEDVGAKLWDVGVLGTGGGGKGKLSDVERKVTGIKFIEQGHVRVGPEVITDPAFLVTRNLEDFITWVDSSKIKANILRYRDKLDDFDLL